jgi:tetratricopeptide (TPR) repeat protein
MAGVLYINIGDFEAAERYLNESRRLATEDGQRWELVNVLAFQGGLAIHRGASGDSEAARTLLQEAVELARQEGDERLLTRPLNRLGLVANEEGNYELARDLFLQALVIADRHDFVGGALVHRNNLAEIAVDVGDHGSARAALGDLFPVVAQTGKTGIAADAVLNTGILAIQLGRPILGLRLLAAAAAAMDRSRYRGLTSERERHQRWIRIARERADDDADAAWREGLQLSLDQAVAEAQPFLSDAPVPGPTASPPSGLAKGPTEPAPSGSFVRRASSGRWATPVGRPS